MPRSTVRLMAVATAVVIANMYFAQPLEDVLARAMTVPVGAVGVVLTLFQVGFAAGLAFLVPLGDLLERRRLVAVMLSVSVLGMVVLATAPKLEVLALGAVLVGMTSVVAQIIVPFAAHLAAAHERGRIVSTVMSGLLIGVLVSRTVAGLLAQIGGWRAVFAVGAAATAIVGVPLYRSLPTAAPTTTLTYPKLLGSVLTLVRDEPLLQVRMTFGALAFASFSAFWSSVGFMLAKPPYSWNSAAIGAIALIGVAGALVARIAGHLADQGYASLATGGSLVVLCASYAALFLGGNHIVALVLGVAAMDMGAQGIHISNQSVVYRLRPDAHSRITTAYMTSHFAGGALGSGLASVLIYPHFDWTGVCLLGATFPAIGILIWSLDQLRGNGSNTDAP